LLERLQVSDQPQFREDVWTAVEQRVHLFQPYQGVLELLAELRTTGCGLAVVTNSRRSHVEPALKRWEASHLFDTLVSIEDVSYGKPDPEAIHKALNTLHVSPVDAFMIGDSPADLLAGSRALVRTVAFSPEQNRAFFPAELLLSHAPNHTTGSYSELRSLLLENV
jgi:HAD superfamily hydrolase (TIGR01509 family)